MKLTTPTFHNQSPFYEVWYGKLNVTPDTAFWFRYTLLNGVTRESACWAILFHKGKITAKKETHLLSDIILDSSSVRLPSGYVDGSHVVGRVSPLTWSLEYQNVGGSFDHVPKLMKALKVSKSYVVTPVMHGLFSGMISVGGDSISVSGAPGMIGHIWGKRQALEWTWAHCNQFDSHSDVVFEGLSARIPLLRRPSPPLTALYLKYHGREYCFNDVRSLLRTGSTFQRGGWEFDARGRDLSVHGKVTSPDKSIAVITYTDTDDSKLYCHNSKLGDITLEVVDHQRNKRETIVARHSAALEWVSRQTPKEPVQL